MGRGTGRTAWKRWQSSIATELQFCHKAAPTASVV
ncbi:DUF3934 family protein [Pandoraea iniqua]